VEVGIIWLYEMKVIYNKIEGPTSTEGARLQARKDFLKVKQQLIGFMPV